MLIVLTYSFSLFDPLCQLGPTPSFWERTQSHFDLFGILPLSIEELLQEICLTDVDVIILNQSSFLIQPTHLLELLPAASIITLMVVGSYDNSLSIYHKCTVAITHSNDLGNALRHVVRRMERYQGGREIAERKII